MKSLSTAIFMISMFVFVHFLECHRFSYTLIHLRSQLSCPIKSAGCTNLYSMDAYIVGLRMASPALELEHNNKPVVAFDLITLPRAEVGIDPDK